jgi:hypothetical protein
MVADSPQKMEIRLARLDVQPVGARPASLIPGRDQRRFLELDHQYFILIIIHEMARKMLAVSIIGYRHSARTVTVTYFVGPGVLAGDMCAVIS